MKQLVSEVSKIDMKQGWELKKLGDVLKLEYGKPLPADKRNPNGKYPVYGANGEKNRSDEYYYDKLSIIVGRKGSAGEINFTEEKFWPLDVTYFVTFDNKKYDLNFIYYLLSNLELPSLAKGVKPGINRNEVYSINAPIPPLTEQKRIVAILDKTFESIAKAKENAKKNLKNVNEIFESCSQSVFENKGDGWEENEFGEIIELLTDYHANGSYKVLKANVELKESEDYGWMVRSTDFENNFENNKRYITKEAYNFLNKSKIFGNEIIISKIGNAGKVYLMPKINRPCSLAMNLFLIRLNEKRCLSKYVYLYLKSKNGREQIESRILGTTTKTITKANVRSIKIYIPALNNQQSIVTKLDTLSTETKKLEAVYEKKLADLEELKKSILQKAFDGELK